MWLSAFNMDDQAMDDQNADCRAWDRPGKNSCSVAGLDMHGAVVLRRRRALRCRSSGAADQSNIWWALLAVFLFAGIAGVGMFALYDLT